jgi:hypothetical protein
MVGRPGRKRRKDNIDTNLVRLSCAQNWLSVMSLAGCGVLYRLFYQITNYVCDCIRFSLINYYFGQGWMSCECIEPKVPSPVL